MHRIRFLIAGVLLFTITVALRAAAPTVTGVLPAPGSTVTELTQADVTFSEAVTGLSADDLLVNGHSASGLMSAGNTHTFTFSQPLYGTVYFTWSTNHSISDLTLPQNFFDATAPGATWQYNFIDAVAPTLANLFPTNGALVQSLSQIEVTFNEPVSGVDAADLRINGQPATNVIAQPGLLYVFQFAPVVPGVVNVAFATNHGIADFATTPNAFTGASWSYTVNPTIGPIDLVINEINASNEGGLRDEDGDTHDWIEIWNRGTNTVNLAGWSLSDDPEQPGFWVFPSRTLTPGQYLVVFASGKDRRAPVGANRFHTSFQLSGSGEFLGLFSPDSPRVFVSGFAPEFPEQRNDHSFGYDTNRQLRYFAVPTPGATNRGSSIIGVVEPVHFSVARGHFTQPFELTLSCATPGGAIRYTTDGSVPTPVTGQRYVGPVVVNKTTIFRAAAFRTNLLPSLVGTHSYLFNLVPAQRSLPVLSIVTAQTNLTGPRGIIGISNVVQQGDGRFVPADATGYHNPSLHGLAWERPTSVEYIRLEDNSGFQADCGIRVQGSDYQRPRTTSGSKFSYRLYFRGDYGPGRLNFPLFPLTSQQDFDQVVVRAGFNDPADPFIRDELTRRLSHDMGNVSSHGTFVNLFVNGLYKGYYNPCERVHEEMLQSYVGGSDEWDVVGPSFAQGAGVPGVIDGDRTSFASLVSYVNGQNPAVPAVYDEVGRRLDLVNFVDYCLLNVYCGMGDWPPNNWRAGKDRGPGGTWRFIVWDGEWAMGIYGRVVTRNTFTESGGGPDDSGLNSTGNSEIAQMYQRLRGSAEFRLLWADRIHKHFFNGGALENANITNRFGQMRTIMVGVLPNMATDILGTWVPQRRNIIFGHFNLYGLVASSNAPVFNQFGGRVAPGFALTMTATNVGATIYYTTDGKDPRVKYTNTVSASAVSYASPLVLTQSVVVKARTRTGTNWSALVEAPFEVAFAGSPLRITEIHYNPPDGNQYEFLELANVGTAPVNLGGMFFDGIIFTFLQGTVLAPGATLVLASDRNPAQFAAKYPGVTVTGYFGGGLENAGERITLKNVSGAVVTSVDYNDEDGWPTAADGGGRSLVILDPRGGTDDPANWLASSDAGGNPGVLAPAPTPGDVRLNEVMAENFSAVNNGGTFPDWVELHNAGAVAANLTGWSLTDDGDARQFVFPPGTMIPPGGYLVVWCDATTNATPGMHTGFALDRDGESVFLYDANTNRVDAISFGFQLADVSIGRVGGAWQLTGPTPNGANVAAATGAATELSINEWLANPPSGQSDWVELFNRSGALPVALRGIHLGTTGVVQQVTSLAFVPPGGFVQLFCDEGAGWDHLDFRLPASGGFISLADSFGVEFDRVIYAAQTEGVSRGRLPDGTATFANFPGSASPGASNYVITYTGPVINEVLARNQTAVTNNGRVMDFVELFNPGAAAFNLGGMSLSVDEPDAGQFIFAPNTIVPAGGYLIVWCDGSRAASTNASDLNTGRSLDGDSGGVYLFNAAGQVVNSVEYGFQVADKSIGRSGVPWRLLETPNPGAANSAAHALGPVTALRLNEWIANPASGPDWFELFNSTNNPVEMSGLILTDDPSVAGTNATRIAPLSFIEGQGFVKWIADGQPEQGRHHASFSLDAEGETLRLYQTNGTAVIDAVFFGAQPAGISSGRLPDGVTNNVVPFPGSASPEESNYQLVPDVVISEVLTRTSPALDQFIEVENRSAAAPGIGGWFLSDDQANFKKFRVPDETVLPAHGFVVFSEAQFNSGASGFALDGLRGGEVWLSAADSAGNLTGQRVNAKFGASAADVAFGRIETSAGVDYAALSARTAGVSNAAPLVGPIVISEIMYNPPETTNSGDVEFVELHNISVAAVPLFDPVNPATTWRLDDAVSFSFPSNTTMSAGGYLLVVGFDPADAPQLSAFRARHGISAAVPVLGPWQGNLDNGGDDVELLRNEDTLVQNIRVDRANYSDSVPWPSGAADGGGLSLQRRAPATYGNDPESWVTDTPTPGGPNGGGIVAPPVITQSPSDVTVLSGVTVALDVAATGGTPFGYQWRQNGLPLANATNSTLLFDYTALEHDGEYDVVVSNPGGVAVSEAARLVVGVPPEILQAPVDVLAFTNAAAQFRVAAIGAQPLTYQWRHNGELLPGETSPTLARSKVQIPDHGLYEVTVENPFGSVTLGAFLHVLERPAFIQQPLGQTVALGETVTLAGAASGHPLPFHFEWRRGSSTPLVTNIVQRRYDFFTFTAPNIVTSVQYRLVVRNMANSNGIGSAIVTINVVADTDADGMPDFWENDHNFSATSNSDRDSDADNDRLSNWEEYRAGTNPTDAASFLRIDGPVLGNGATLSFGAISNRTYSVQFSDALGSGWQTLAGIVASASNRVEVVVDPNAGTNRFYRATTPWQP